MSKVIERVVSGRLNEHIIKYSMFNPLQSPYRDKHSRETALIKVQINHRNDISLTDSFEDRTLTFYHQRVLRSAGTPGKYGPRILLEYQQIYVRDVWLTNNPTVDVHKNKTL